MNARQKAKKLKKENASLKEDLEIWVSRRLNTAFSDNDRIRESELYKAICKYFIDRSIGPNSAMRVDRYMLDAIDRGREIELEEDYRTHSLVVRLR